MHKIVNGKKVDLTKDQADKIIEDWKKSALKVEDGKNKHRLELDKKNLLKTKISQQLSLSSEEVELLFKGK